MQNYSPVQFRSLPPRRGSVLILVVTLLVLLALMGTAYIATVRLDRLQVTGAGSSALINGVGAMAADPASMDSGINSLADQVKKALRDDVFSAPAPGGTYRPPGNLTSYKNYDALSVTDDLYLASRLPQLNATPVPSWPFISHWMGGAGQFDSPWNSASANPTFPVPAFPASINSINPSTYNNRVDMVPTHIELTYPVNFNRPAQMNGRARIYPALNVGGTIVLAGDADGDGIADAGLFRLSTTPGAIDYINPASANHPITYWGAVRIVDHNSAINANTAWSRDQDWTTVGGGLPAADLAFLGTFRSNVGLPQDPTVAVALRDNELLSLNQWRYAAGFPAGRADVQFVSVGDAAEMQLARRIYAPAGGYKAISPDAGVSLAYHMGLLDRDLSRTDLEQRLYNSAYMAAANYSPNLNHMTKYYPANEHDLWFHTSFNFDLAGTRQSYFTGRGYPAPQLPTRALLVSENQVSNLVPLYNPLANGGMTALPVENAVPKCSINTAPFAELWRGFWQVMCNDSGIAQDPGVGDANIGQAMFKSSRRSGTALSGFEMLQLRAAQAAVNAEWLRAPNYNNAAPYNGTNRPNGIARKVTLVNTTGAPTYELTVHANMPHPYITQVVIDNDVTDKKYIAVEIFNPYSYPLNVSNLAVALLDRSTMTLGPAIYTFPNGSSIPAEGYVILEQNLQAVPPANITVDPAASKITVSGLDQLLAHELILFQPHRVDGTLSSDVPNYDETGGDLTERVPVDQFDATGLTIPATPGTAERRLYARPTITSPATNWQWVYPGDYVAGVGHTTIAKAPTDAIELGKAEHNGTGTRALTIQICNSSPTFLNKPTAAGPNRFPFGGFARNGDILETPFIGSYRLKSGGTLAEINSVSIDSFYAEDGHAADDANEQVGRFCPIPPGPDPSYGWAAKLLDYFSAIQNPNDDYLPQTNPLTYPGPAPDPIGNGGVVGVTAANGQNENMAGVQGLINVNTADVQVLAALPLVVNGAGVVDAPATQTLAVAIVQDRLTNGPFKTLFDLNRVPGFVTAVAEPTSSAQGDLWPANVGGQKAVNGDYRAKYMQLARLSNLLTTRSDTFTCYVLVQAWQDAGSQTPVLLDERRTAFIVDRSTLNSVKNDYTRDLKITPVPVK